MAAALEEWLAANWLLALTAAAAVTTAGATIATALPTWFNRRDQKFREEPFVECTINPAIAGWVRIELVVRNFNPFAIYVRELRIKRPRRAALWSEGEAFSASEDVNSRRAFVASDKLPRLVARIDNAVSPTGSMASGFGPFPDRPVDQLRRNFYLSPRDASTRFKLRMVLICEVRGRVVRTIEVALNRTVTRGA